MFVLWHLFLSDCFQWRIRHQIIRGENEVGGGGGGDMHHYYVIQKRRCFREVIGIHSYLTLGIIQTLHKTDVFKGLWTGSGLSWSNMKHYQEMQTWRFSIFFVNRLQVFKRPPTWYRARRSPLPSTRPLHPVPSHSGGAMKNVCCYWTSTCRHCDEPQTSLLVCLEDKPALELRLLFALRPSDVLSDWVLTVHGTVGLACSLFHYPSPYRP